MAAADRRAAILDAARSAFADRGYHETSLDSVAERAGVSKALLYEHFGSKRELYVAMLEMHVHELVERISGAVPGGSCSGTQMIPMSRCGSTASAMRSPPRSSS